MKPPKIRKQSIQRNAELIARSLSGELKLTRKQAKAAVQLRQIEAEHRAIAQGRRLKN